MLQRRTNADYIYAKYLGVTEKVVRRLGGAAYLRSLNDDARKVLLNESQRLIEACKNHEQPSVTRSLRCTDPVPQQREPARWSSELQAWELKYDRLYRELRPQFWFGKTFSHQYWRVS